MTDAIDAAQEIYNVLAQDDNGTPADGLAGIVNKVFFLEPRAGEMVTPLSVTVLITGETAFEFKSIVRVYGFMGQLTAYDIQRRVLAAWTVIEDLLNQQSIWTRGEWSNDFLAELNAYVADCPMLASRTDF